MYHKQTHKKQSIKNIKKHTHQLTQNTVEIKHILSFNYHFTNAYVVGISGRSPLTLQRPPHIDKLVNK